MQKGTIAHLGQLISIGIYFLNLNPSGYVAKAIRLRHGSNELDRPSLVMLSAAKHLCVHEEVTEPEPATGPVIGVDVGVKTLATVSDGREMANPKALRKRLKKLQRLSRWHSRKQKGSANRKKSQHRLARLHARIAHVRQDALHKATAGLVAKNKPSDQRPAVIVLEDLNVSGMLKNRHVSRAIADVGLYEFRRQMEYKAKDAGCRVLVVSRWEPSSQMCSGCGWRHPNLQLSDRVFLCQECGLTIDRDLNAAQNLAALA